MSNFVNNPTNDERAKGYYSAIQRYAGGTVFHTHLEEVSSPRFLRKPLISYAFIASPENPSRTVIMGMPAGGTPASKAHLIGEFIRKHNAAVLVVESPRSATAGQIVWHHQSVVTGGGLHSLFRNFTNPAINAVRGSLLSGQIYAFGSSMGGATLLQHMVSKTPYAVSIEPSKRRAIQATFLENPRLKLGWQNYPGFLRAATLPVRLANLVGWAPSIGEFPISNGVPEMDKDFYKDLAKKKLAGGHVDSRYGSTVFFQDWWTRLKIQVTKPTFHNLAIAVFNGDQEVDPFENKRFLLRHGGKRAYYVRTDAHGTYSAEGTARLARAATDLYAGVDNDHLISIRDRQGLQRNIPLNHFREATKTLRPNFIHGGIGMVGGLALTSGLMLCGMDSFWASTASTALMFALPLIHQGPFRRPGVGLCGEYGFGMMARLGGIFKNEAMSLSILTGLKYFGIEGRSAQSITMGITFGWDIVAPLIRGAILDYNLDCYIKMAAPITRIASMVLIGIGAINKMEEICTRFNIPRIA